MTQPLSRQLNNACQSDQLPENKPRPNFDAYPYANSKWIAEPWLALTVLVKQKPIEELVDAARQFKISAKHRPEQ